MISISFHKIKSAVPHHYNGDVPGGPFSVVTISDSSGNDVTFYSVTEAQAEAIALAFSTPLEESANADA